MNAPRRSAPASAPASVAASTPARKLVKDCGCSGTRWCVDCLDPDLRRSHGMDPPTELPAFLRERPQERGSWPDGGPVSDRDSRSRIAAFDPASQSCPGHPGFEGVHVLEDLITPAESDRLLEAIEAQSFLPAQSGKQKQHFGAQVNFNKRKVRAQGFQGLPAWARWLEARTRARLALPSRAAVADGEVADEDVARGVEEIGEGPRRRSWPPSPALRRAMETFRTTDVFVLRYRERDRSNLDFHVDDTFAYGEAILALSLESDSVMTFVRERPDLRQRSGAAPGWDCVRVKLPARSLSILYGAARFEWQHAMLAYDIRGRRTSITLRTLSPELRGTAVGRTIEQRAAASGVGPGDASPPLAGSECCDAGIEHV